jgi:hypothetical protein
MKRFRFVLTAVALVLTVHRLPAPISEESPTPKPRPVSTPRPKPKIATTPRPKATPISFSGNWTGLINSHCGDIDYSGQLTLTVSSDERSVTSQLEGAHDVRACVRSGSLLQWQDSNYSRTLQMNRDGGTATYSCRWALDGAACLASGVVTRR